MSTSTPSITGSEPTSRTAAEWVTLSISAAVVIGILALITVLYARGDEIPATVIAEAKLDEVREASGSYYVPVEVTNEGELTVEDVIIEGELTSDGQVETADITLTYLAGGERSTGAFIFSEDPTEGELTVRPISYKDPR